MSYANLATKVFNMDAVTSDPEAFITALDLLAAKIGPERGIPPKVMTATSQETGEEEPALAHSRSTLEEATFVLRDAIDKWALQRLHPQGKA